MINIRQIDESNFDQILKMKQPEEEHFVAPNVKSLAQAWLYRDVARPFAIYDDDRLVGFLMLSWEEAERSVGLWRFMIAVEEQNKGYGQQTLQLLIQQMKEEHKFDCMILDCVPENQRGMHIYEKFGFQPTGEVDEGEMVMRLDF